MSSFFVRETYLDTEHRHEAKFDNRDQKSATALFMKSTPSHLFEVAIDEYQGIACSASFDPKSNKFLLSLLNDYEDGKWRLNKFKDFIWDNVAETALSLREREALVDKSHSTLRESAKNLRLTEKPDDVGKGSELAEIILYALMKHHYGALPVVPKIFYKQNSQDNAKGADSVHITLSQNSFSLWLGEAKFFNSNENSKFTDIIKSINNSLASDKIRKENSIITNINDLKSFITDADLLKNIQDTLSKTASIDKLKPKLNIPILLIHECKTTAAQTAIDEVFRKWIREHHAERAQSFFEKKQKKLSSIHLYSEIKFHFILLPVPSKSSIVNSFLATAKFLKDL